MADNFRPQKESFLNGLRSDNNPPKEHYMRKVKDLHGQLRATVSNLSDKVGLLLKEREKDFLAAYRHHMYNVQKELQEAKQKVREAENAMKNNEQIRKLKKERDWFRGEAIRLDNLVEEMKTELDLKKEQKEEIDDDRAWLQKQLKNAKKQIKILRAELEANARASSTFATESGLPRMRKSHLPPAASSPMSRRRTPQQHPQQGQRSGGSWGRGPANTFSHAGNNNEKWPQQQQMPLTFPLDEQLIPNFEQKERSLQDQIYRLKQDLKMERRRTRQLRAAANDSDTGRNELEDFFLLAVEDVKRHISRRKAKAKQLSSKQNKRKIFKQRSMRGMQAEGDIAMPTSLKDFTATDRHAAVEALLGNEEVIKFIYSNLFPAVVDTNEEHPSPLGMR